MCYQENSSNAYSCPSFPPEWVRCLTQFADRVKVMGPGVIIQGSWDVAQGLYFPDSATDTNKNLFEKDSAGQIHEDLQVMQRIKE